MTTVINFTKANLESLPIPASGRVEYQDARTPGLKIRVTPNDVKTFCVLKRVKGGAPLRTTLGRFPEMSIEQARRQAAVILAEIAEGGNPAEIKRALKAEPTFADLFKLYFERHAKVHKKSAGKDAQQYKQFLESPLGKKKISAITRDTIATIHSKITSDGHPAVANRVLALLSVVFNRAIEWGVTQTNPCTNLRRNREISRDRFLQSDEFPRFVTALHTEPNPTIHDYILVSLFTGARRSNVLSMKWSEVNLAEGTWRIPMTKNGTPQIIPLPAQSIELLKKRRKIIEEAELFVFPGSGSTGHLAEPRKAWKRFLERANITNLRIHDLRRTMGSWQAKTGASLSIIGKSLNHKSTQTTAIYARLDMDPVRESMNTATEAMLKAGQAKPKA
ncbi:MAG: site-specific integrase [Gallionella sp.]